MSSAFDNIKNELAQMYSEEKFSDKKLTQMTEDLIELFKIHFNNIRKENKNMFVIDTLIAA